MDSLNPYQGATVFSVDGDKLGKVIGLEGDNLIVEKGWFFPTDNAIPMTLMSRTDEHKIYLSVGKDHAFNQDWPAGTHDAVEIVEESVRHPGRETAADGHEEVASVEMTAQR